MTFFLVFVVFAMVAAFVGALAIAAILALVGLAFGAPQSRAVATALVVGGLIVFPVHAEFYTDASSAAEGGSVGRCSGILPTFAELFYFANCND